MKIHRTRTRRSLTARRGMAPLEMVMSLPFLLACLALIIAVSIASIRKSDAAIAARNEAWQQRHEGDGEQPFALSGLGTKGQRSAIKTNQFVMPPPPISTGQNVTAESRNQILTGAWSDPLAELSKDQPDFVPHFGTLGMIASQGKFSLGSLDRLVDKLANLASGGIGVAGFAPRVANLALYGAGQYFRLNAALAKPIDILSDVIDYIGDAASYLDDTPLVDLVDSVVEEIFDEFDKYEVTGGIKGAFKAVKKAAAILKNLRKLQNRIYDLFMALAEASIGADYEPNPASFSEGELKGLFDPDVPDDDDSGIDSLFP